MDALAHLLHDLRVESTLYCRFELAAPWAVAYPAGDTAAFHVVTEGRCRLEVVDGDGARRLPQDGAPGGPRGARGGLTDAGAVSPGPGTRTSAPRARPGARSHTSSACRGWGPPPPRAPPFSSRGCGPREGDATRPSRRG